MYIEDKEWAEYQPGQLGHYAMDVRHRQFGDPERGRVLSIIPAGRRPIEDDRPGPDGPRWTTVTWQEVAKHADDSGRAWKDGGADWRWRKIALQPDAPAQWRYLAEFIIHLEERSLARMEPLAPEDVIVARRADAFSKSIQTLLDTAIEATANITLGNSDRSGQCLRRVLESAVAEPHWMNEVSRFGPARLEWHYADRDDVLDSPAFWLGLILDQIPEEGHLALSDEAWQEQLPRELLPVIAEGDRCIYFGRQKYLSELVVSGSTFDEQVQALVLWAEQVVGEINALPAPPHTDPEGVDQLE